MAKQVKDTNLRLSGEVIDGNHGIFKVKIDGGNIVNATLSGNIRKHNIRILVGDRVDIECSEFDPSNGRIVFRHK